MSDDPRLPNAGYTPPLASGLAQQPVYPDENPPARPTNIPPERPATPLAHLDTAYLNNAQKALRSNIPSDPTFMAHVGAILRAIIAFDLQHPDRIAADKTAADKAIADEKERQDAALAARHETEKAAIPTHGELTLAQQKEVAELEAQHEAERRDVKRKRAVAELDAKQETDRKEFARIQQEQRQAALTDAQPAPAQ